ncbi:MAG: ABC transporter ATP-binding protein [Salinimicrobium sp.]
MIIETSAKNIILETRDLSIGYRKKQQEIIVASGIDLQLHEGELVAVIGVNGVGKSTFLRTISGIQGELSGKVLIKGEDRHKLPPEELATWISLVLTEQPLSKNLSVAELVALGRQPYTNWLGSLTAEDRKMVKKALELVQIEDIQHKKCFELSDGQLQKVLIARALAQDTPVMILDEPTSHLDMYHKAQVLQLLKKLSRQTGKAIIFATHEINLALQLCDQMLLMKKSGILQGSPQELIEKRAFEDIFPSDLIIFDSGSRSFRIKS